MSIYASGSFEKVEWQCQWKMVLQVATLVATQSAFLAFLKSSNLLLSAPARHIITEGDYTASTVQAAVSMAAV
jgi:hypothetical protein